MSDSYPGFVLALTFIATCHVFSAANGSEGLWQANLDPSVAIRGGYVPGYGESWLCRYIDDNGFARVGSYFVRNPGCRVHKNNLINPLEIVPHITDMSKIQFLSSDGSAHSYGAHSYAWIGRKNVMSLDGAISTGSATSQEQTYVCRATIFKKMPLVVNPFITVLGRDVVPGTYYPSEDKCRVPLNSAGVADYDILFDLYSMCDNNRNPQNPAEYKKGTWSSTFDETKAVEAGHEEDYRELSYICRVQKDSKMLLGKHKSSSPSCEYVEGDKVVEYSEAQGMPQEVLVSSPSNFFGWSPQRLGRIAPGAMYGYAAQDGEPTFICRALADLETTAPRSPGSLRQAEGVCVTSLANRVRRNPIYEVLVDMRRTCDNRGGRNILTISRDKRPNVMFPTRRYDSLEISLRHNAPIDATTSRSEDAESSNADADECLARGLNAVKLAFDSCAVSCHTL